MSAVLSKAQRKRLAKKLKLKQNHYNHGTNHNPAAELSINNSVNGNPADNCTVAATNGSVLVAKKRRRNRKKNKPAIDNDLINASSSSSSSSSNHVPNSDLSPVLLESLQAEIARLKSQLLASQSKVKELEESESKLQEQIVVNEIKSDMAHLIDFSDSDLSMIRKSQLNSSIESANNNNNNINISLSNQSQLSAVNNNIASNNISLLHEELEEAPYFPYTHWFSSYA
jgi:hypothetical protein